MRCAPVARVGYDAVVGAVCGDLHGPSAMARALLFLQAAGMHSACPRSSCVSEYGPVVSGGDIRAFEDVPLYDDGSTAGGIDAE